VSDLVIFVGLVGLVAAAGIGVGMIVAGRIDRVLVPAAPSTGDPSPVDAPPPVHEEPS
jgi:hypothetical protein